MFVSAGFLGINYGVDDKIAKFFVDREPPKNNLYWKDKLMYLRFEPGWLFIPLIVDILFRLGIQRSHLISEEFVGLMEKIGHITALEETKQITSEQATEQYIQLSKDNCKNESFRKNLLDFAIGGTNNSFVKLITPFKALHRGDAFLFSLCALEFDENLQEKIVEYWFALISTLLLLDDAEDLEIDRANGDDNAFLETNFTAKGTGVLKEMVRRNLQLLSSLNRPMALMLDKKYKALESKPHLKQFLNP
jgi:hypothetical protein